MRSRTALNNWHWRLANSNGQSQTQEAKADLTKWTAVSSFPSVIQQELLSKEIIPNHHIGENERHIQWVGACDWEYSTTFATPSHLLGIVELVFEGLDTFATVTLNGCEILRSDNQFIPARVDVKNILKPTGQQNELILYFESALKAGSRLEEKYGKRKSIMRDRRRNHTRKAQYAWAWDWGPIVVTCGPWKPVYLDTYENRIESVYIRTTQLSEDHTRAQITIDVEVSRADSNSQALVTIEDGAGVQVSRISIALNGKVGCIQWVVPSPHLWWPNGQGTPHLYTACVEILSQTSTIQDTHNTKFGIRTIEVIQRPLKAAPGETFMFRINGRDIFVQGGNWIPASNILTSVLRKRYFDWVKLAVRSNLNMIRVWGGGVYECEDFFDACDELGILVWHDFAFACGDYPTYAAFLESLREEAESQTRRLRGRACLALLAGGNEDFLIADWTKIPYDHSDTKGPFLDTAFPQREIYLSILPKITAQLAPTTKYWPSSPWGGKEANDTTVGDIHQWSVWHLTQEPYQDYKKLSGRFVSEFGMHGFPVERTVEYFLRGTDQSQRHPQSRTIDCHNKGHGAHTRIARYLAENFRFDMSNLSNFIYSSQLMQSEAYGYALRDWKRMFNGEGEELCAGAIIWQLNDVYPSTSWAYVDYFLRPKPAFYTIKRAFAKMSVAVERTPNTRWIDEDRRRETEIPTFDIFAHNTSEERSVRLEMRAYDFYYGTWTNLGTEASREVVLKARQNTELGKLERQPSWTEESLIVLEVTLVDLESSAVLARHVDWPEPFRYLTWPKDTSLSIKVEGVEWEWENQVTLCSNQPLKGVWLEPVYDGSELDDDGEPHWEDNMVDLMPGREIIVGVNDLRGRKVKARYMYDWEIEQSPKARI